MRLLIALVLPVVLVIIISRGDYLNPFSDPITGRLVAFVCAFAAVTLFNQAGLQSEMIADQAVWWRTTTVFGFWCTVLALCAPEMGAEILGKAWLFGLIGMNVSAACEWSYQFALDLTPPASLSSLLRSAPRHSLSGFSSLNLSIACGHGRSKVA